MGQYESKVKKNVKNSGMRKAACDGCSAGCGMSCSFTYRVPILAAKATK